MFRAWKILDEFLCNDSNLVAELREELPHSFPAEVTEESRSVFLLIEKPVISGLRDAFIDKYKDTKYEARVAEIPSLNQKQIRKQFHWSRRSRNFSEAWFTDKVGPRKIL